MEISDHLLPVMRVIFLATLWVIPPCKSNLRSFGLQEAHAEILGKPLDCRELDQCKESKGKIGYICATSGKTYENLCTFMRDKCDNKDTEFDFEHHGECTASEKCMGGRKFALKRSQTKNGLFIPSCSKTDGTYTEIQCHKDTRYCWCSTPTGVPIAGSDTYDKQPDCTAHRIKSPKSNSSHQTTGTRTSKGGCAGDKRKTFIDNFLKKLLDEFWRINSKKKLESGKYKEAALTWKFNLLDTREDGKLTRKEYKNLQKIIRTSFEPKQCTRKFPKICDKNSDKKITINEWLKCFGADVKGESSEGGKKKPKKNKGKSELSQTMGTEAAIVRPNCSTDHQEAMESISNGDTNVFLPECEDNGRYKAVQCYGSLNKTQWYCFCVNIVTGKMIPDSYLPNVLPKCYTGILPNPWPKCEGKIKENKFLMAIMRLMSKLAKEYSRLSTFQMENLEDQQKLNIVFVQLDKNKSGFLEKKEKRNLRKLLKKQKKNVWRCGKKIHKVCDIDLDEKISSEEFYACLSSRKKKNNLVQPTEAPEKSTRRPGLNPFIEQLTAAE